MPVINVPAYVTVTAQSYSENGHFLACASDNGKIAIFSVVDIISEKNDGKPNSGVFFTFDANTCLEQHQGLGSINAMATTKNLLIVAITFERDSAILAFNWSDLKKQRAKLMWSIEASSGLLPSDINSIDVDKSNEKLVIGGGQGISHNEPNQDFAVRLIDLETRMAVCKPMSGHTGYLHSVSLCQKTKMIASCGEDGTARIWDSRQGKKPCTAILEPYVYNLQRPKLGNYLGDVSINGDWLVTGGGAKPAIWHLRSQSPTVIPELPDNCHDVHVAQILDVDNDRVVIGGQFQSKKMYHFSMSGDLMAEVGINSSCLYSVQAVDQGEFKVLSACGASNQIDMCTHNFSYSDNFVSFPLY